MVHNVIAYLKGTKDLGVVFRRERELKLSLFADTDYANRCNERRWIPGVAVILGNTAVNASSMTQHCMTLSTSEAEFVAMVHGATNAIAIKAVLDFVEPHLNGSAINIMTITKGLEKPRVFTAARIY